MSFGCPDNDQAARASWFFVLTPPTTSGTSRVPWPLVTAVVLFGSGLVFASVALDYRLDAWGGPITTRRTYDTVQSLYELDLAVDQVMFRGFVTMLVVLALTVPFLALRRTWASVVTGCLAVLSVPMAVFLGFRGLGVGKLFEESGWATFCGYAAEPLILVGVVATLVTSHLNRRRVHG